MKHIFLYGFIFCFLNGRAQVDSIELKYLNNHQIKFDLIHATLSAQTKRPHPIGYFVEIEMTSRIKKYFKSKPQAYWIEKLGSEGSDWAANILLCYLYKREASTVYFIKIGVLNWKAVKETEITYWKDFLSKK